MTRIFLIFIFSLGIFSNAIAQQGEVQFEENGKIDSLVQQNSNRTLILGYRIQLFSDSNKSLVDKARIECFSKFPKIETYILFKAPNYILKFGDFWNKEEGQILLDELQTMFAGAFLVKEMINMPKSD